MKGMNPHTEIEMLSKIKNWWQDRKLKKLTAPSRHMSFTTEQLEKAYHLGYTDGKRDGIAIAREQATKSLKEVLWHQNQAEKTRRR